jgi:hypothetical protein
VGVGGQIDEVVVFDSEAGARDKPVGDIVGLVVYGGFVGDFGGHHEGKFGASLLFGGLVLVGLFCWMFGFCD